MNLLRRISPHFPRLTVPFFHLFRSQRERILRYLQWSSESRAAGPEGAASARRGHHRAHPERPALLRARAATRRAEGDGHGGGGGGAGPGGRRGAGGLELQRGPEPAHARQARAPPAGDGREERAPQAEEAETVLAAVERHRHCHGIMNRERRPLPTHPIFHVHSFSI